MKHIITIIMLMMVFATSAKAQIIGATSESQSPRQNTYSNSDLYKKGQRNIKTGNIIFLSDGGWVRGWYPIVRECFNTARNSVVLCSKIAPMFCSSFNGFLEDEWGLGVVPVFSASYHRAKLEDVEQVGGHQIRRDGVHLRLVRLEGPSAQHAYIAHGDI